MITVTSLTKVYQHGAGISDVSLVVRSGEAFGLLGPLGAGKSVVIRHILGLESPTRGSCTVGGLDCRAEGELVRQNVGYVPTRAMPLHGMTGEEFLRFCENMHGKTASPQKYDLIERFEIDINAKIRRDQPEFRQKLAIVAAFMHDPSILVLDDPVASMPPIMQHRFYDLLIAEKNRGKTLLLASRAFEACERICDRAGLLRAGRLAVVEDMPMLKKNARKVYTVTLGRVEDIVRLRACGLQLENERGDTVDIVVRNDYRALLTALSSCYVKGLTDVQQSLQQLMPAVYGREASV